MIDTPEHEQPALTDTTELDASTDLEHAEPPYPHESEWNDLEEPIAGDPITPSMHVTQYTTDSGRGSAKPTAKKVGFQLPRRPRTKIAVRKTGDGFRRNPPRLAKSVAITRIKEQFHPSGRVQMRTVMLGQQCSTRYVGLTTSDVIIVLVFVG